MPCFSQIKTKLTDGQRIADSLKALGYQVTQDGDNVNGTKDRLRISFSSGRDGYFASGDTANLAKISKKYAEIGIRTWAKRNGYAVTETDGTKMTLVNRRK